MHKFRTIVTFGLMTSSVMVSVAHAADRPEKVKPARVAVADKCPIVSETVTAKEFATDTEAAFLGLLLASVAGEAVKSGLNAAGDAVEAVSREQGFVAEGTAYFDAYRLKRRDTTKHKTARLLSAEKCIIIFREGDSGDLEQLAASPDLVGFKAFQKANGGNVALFSPDADTVTAAIDALKSAGLNVPPKLYIEARLVPLREGLVIRPVFVWYREKLEKGAPAALSPSELHIDLATPGPIDIGTLYSSSRLKLPKIKPGMILTWEDLRGSTSVVLPARPTATFADTQLASLNGLYAAEATAKIQKKVAGRASEAAIAKHKAKPTPESAAEVKSAAYGLADAEAALKAATTAAGGSDEPTLGVTNVKARFVVVRDKRKFGMAIAKLLKGQSESMGKAVTEALTPKPAWAATDTAYLTAQADLAAKQRAYDTALASGTATDLPALLDQVTIAKAKLNEAAVAINLPLPYPSLF